MKKTGKIFALFLLFLLGCSDKKFNPEKWKTNQDEKFYMLNDIVENKRLLGKTKNEVVELLDTVDIKEFNYSNNSWMYILSIPHFVLATKTPVEVMDIEFDNDNVKQVTIRRQ